MDGLPRLRTTGKIARELGTTPQRIRRIVETRCIPPAAMAGNTRLFDATAMARIRYELNLLDAKQKGGAMRC